MSELREISQPGVLRDPVTIVALGVQRRGWRTALQALQYLVDEWEAEPTAKLGPEPFYDLTVRRPESRWVGDVRTLEWPEATIYVGHPAGAGRDFVLLRGFEPNFYWRTFVKEVAAYLDSLGSKTLVALRSFPANVPHTRTAPITLNASDIELEVEFGATSRNTRYEGPSDISGVLAAELQSLRWRTVDLTVLQPDYFRRLPNAAASLSLVRLLDQTYGMETPRKRLEEMARDQRNALDAALDSELRVALPQLEQAYEQAVADLSFLVPGESRPQADLPSSHDVVREIERFLRGDSPSDD